MKKLTIGSKMFVMATVLMAGTWAEAGVVLKTLKNADGSPKVEVKKENGLVLLKYNVEVKKNSHDAAYVILSNGRATSSSGCSIQMYFQLELSPSSVGTQKKIVLGFREGQCQVEKVLEENINIDFQFARTGVGDDVSPFSSKLLN